MPPAADWTPFHESLQRTLVRNVAIAVAVGAGVAATSHRLSLLLPASILALWFSLGGHYVEVLSVVRHRWVLQVVRGNRLVPVLTAEGADVVASVDPTTVRPGVDEEYIAEIRRRGGELGLVLIKNGFIKENA